MQNFRHGDVAIKQISELPKNLKKISGATLAFGEITGHHHTLVKERPETMVELFENEKGEKYFKISGGSATLTHQEHKPITIEPGIFVMGIEREYDPILEFRKVQD